MGKAEIGWTEETCKVNLSKLSKESLIVKKKKTLKGIKCLIGGIFQKIKGLK